MGTAGLENESLTSRWRDQNHFKEVACGTDLPRVVTGFEDRCLPSHPSGAPSHVELRTFSTPPARRLITVSFHYRPPRPAFAEPLSLPVSPGAPRRLRQGLLLHKLASHLVLLLRLINKHCLFLSLCLPAASGSPGPSQSPIRQGARVRSLGPPRELR